MHTKMLTYWKTLLKKDFVPHLGVRAVCTVDRGVVSHSEETSETHPRKTLGRFRRWTVRNCT